MVLKIGVPKVMLTKSHMPEMIAFAREHGKKIKYLVAERNCKGERGEVLPLPSS